MVANILNKGVDVNKPSSESGRSALFIAAAKGQGDVVAMLLKHEGVDVNKAAPYDETPLCIAADNGHCYVVAVLLKHEGV